ncbi:OBAP family protein [Thiohalorhabdus methylotrophus]|uniref:OBAP family protein n=1 Tax=Thiohalorhabdus methylotrophus TaxID=3242694 RepID=A0ABV4TTU3_9GAMM
MLNWMSALRTSPLGLAVGLSAAAAYFLLQPGRTRNATRPRGDSKAPRTWMLETGAAVLQRRPPLRGFDTYLAGFHPMKEDPEHQWIAHHWCKVVNEDFIQCLLFDGNTADANLVGVEYIISERLFRQLPEEERGYWHPHNGEILSGQLAAPGLPQAAEKMLMKRQINSYGKTWHLWDTGVDGRAGDDLPFGAPRLAWSFNHDGELQPWLQELRDRELRLRTEERRAARKDLVAFAHPQEGTDALKGRFERPTREIPGAQEKRAQLTGRH